VRVPGTTPDAINANSAYAHVLSVACAALNAAPAEIIGEFWVPFANLQSKGVSYIDTTKTRITRLHRGWRFLAALNTISAEIIGEFWVPFAKLQSEDESKYKYN
jgi:hypothetical protein